MRVKRFLRSVTLAKWLLYPIAGVLLSKEATKNSKHIREYNNMRHCIIYQFSLRILCASDKQLYIFMTTNKNGCTKQKLQHKKPMLNKGIFDSPQFLHFP